MGFFQTKGERMLYIMRDCFMQQNYYADYAYSIYHSNLAPVTVECFYCRYRYNTEGYKLCVPSRHDCHAFS